MKLSKLFSKQALLEYALVAALIVFFTLGAVIFFTDFNDRAFVRGIKRTQHNVLMHYEKAQDFHGLDRAYAETFTKVPALSDLTLSPYTVEANDDSFAMNVHLSETSCKHIGMGVFGAFNGMLINGVEVLDLRQILNACNQKWNLVELISHKVPSEAK